jgi:hypothetical protein
MECRLLRMGMVSLTLAALALPLRLAGAQPPAGKNLYVAAEQLCTQAGGSFMGFDDPRYECEGEDLEANLVGAAEAFCTHAFRGRFVLEPPDGEPIVFYTCIFGDV